MGPTPSDLLLGVLLPAVVAGVLLLALRRALGGAAAGALAVGFGYVAGHVGMRGWRGWVPRESTDWVAVVALLGAVIGAAELTRPGSPGLRTLVRLALAAGATWLVLGRVLERQHPGAGLLRELAMLGAGIAVAWSVIETLAAPTARGGPFAVLLVTAVGAAAVIGISGSVVLAQLAGVLTATVGALLVVCSRGRGADVLAGAASPIALVLGTLVLAGLVLADVPAPAAMLLIAAPAGALLVRLGAHALGRPAGARGSGAGLLVLQLAVCTALVSLAFALAYQASPPMDELGY